MLSKEYAEVKSFPRCSVTGEREGVQEVLLGGCGGGEIHIAEQDTRGELSRE